MRVLALIVSLSKQQMENTAALITFCVCKNIITRDVKVASASFAKKLNTFLKLHVFFIRFRSENYETVR